MAFIFSSTYNSQKGANYTDDENFVIVKSNSINVRSVEGIRITIQMAIHYKVGVTFSNLTQLTQEYLDIYARLGNSTNWGETINKVTIGSVKDAC
jgi:hypothetical protein